jgi:hypothetical protein
VIELTLITLAGLWRSWYGMEKTFPPKIVVKAIGLLIAIGAAYIAVESWWAILYGSIAAASMIISVSKFIDTGWGSWLMGFRYSTHAVLIVIVSQAMSSNGNLITTPVDFTPLGYIALATLAGLMYPIMDRLKYPGGFMGFRAMEFIVGAGAIGGLTLL